MRPDGYEGKESATKSGAAQRRNVDCAMLRMARTKPNTVAGAVALLTYILPGHARRDGLALNRIRYGHCIARCDGNGSAPLVDYEGLPD